MLRQKLTSNGLFVFLAFFTVAAVTVAFYSPRTSFFQDESDVVWLSGPGSQHIFQFINQEPFPPLYHLLISSWIQLAGDLEFSIRAFSGVFYLVTFLAMVQLSRTVLRSDELLVAIVTVGCSSELLLAAVYGRMFTLMFAESSIAILAVVGLFVTRAGRIGLVLALALANLAGMLTHYYFAFVMLAEGIVFLAFAPRQWRTAAIGLVLPGLLFLVIWGPHLIRHLRMDRFANEVITPISWSQMAFEIYVFYGKRWVIIILWLAVLWLVAWSSDGFRLRTWDELRGNWGSAIRDKRLQAFAIIWTTMFGGPVLASLIVGPQFWKGGLPYLPSFFPLAVVLAVLVPRGSMGLKVVLALAVALSLTALEIRGRSKIYATNSGARAGIQLMKDRAKDGDIIVGLDCYVTLFYYYINRSPGAKNVQVQTFPPDLASHPGWYNEKLSMHDQDAYIAELHSYAAGLSRELSNRPGMRVWLVDFSFNPVTTRIVTDAMDLALHRIDTIEVDGGSGGYTKYAVYDFGLSVQTPRGFDN